MIDLIEQSNLYRLIAIAVTLFSFWKIAHQLVDRLMLAVAGPSEWPWRSG